MTGNPSGSNVVIDGAVAVIHSRRLVAETLCIALRSIGIDAHFDLGEWTEFALVDTNLSATIEQLADEGTAVLAFGSADPISVARAARSGATWHVPDDIGFEQVAEHLARLAAGETSPKAVTAPPPDPSLTLIATLTQREREVLRSLVSGRRAAEIAEADFVSVTTVRNQIQSILTKLGAHSQLEAVAIAVRAGWTPLAA
jgi:DNA-binding NarL/FixJ family response regulator